MTETARVQMDAIKVIRTIRERCASGYISEDQMDAEILAVKAAALSA